MPQGLQRVGVGLVNVANAEPLRAAVLTVLQQGHGLIDLVREIDPQIDERIYEGLV